MNMVCPECGLCQSFAVMPMRLQTCPACNRKGTDHYLSVPTMEVRAPVPRAHEIELVQQQRMRLNGSSAKAAT
jgi:NMD protein affecting ribosome stability and mRNA decay